MNKKIKAISFLSVIMAFSAMNEPQYMLKQTKPKKRFKPYELPNGVKEFHFSRTGEVLSKNDRNKIFSCVAINLKNAKRKFDAFVNV